MREEQQPSSELTGRVGTSHAPDHVNSQRRASCTQCELQGGPEDTGTIIDGREPLGPLRAIRAQKLMQKRMISLRRVAGTLSIARASIRHVAQTAMGGLLLADSVEKLHGLALGPVRRGHSTLGEVAIVDPGSI